MSEQFGIDCPFGNSAAVDGEILAVFPAAVLMYDLGNILLSDTAFACDEDGQIGRGYSDGCLKSPVQGGIISDDVVLVFQPLQFL